MELPPISEALLDVIQGLRELAELAPLKHSLTLRGHAAKLEGILERLTEAEKATPPQQLDRLPLHNRGCPND